MKREQIEAEWAKWASGRYQTLPQLLFMFAEHIAKLAVEQERESCAKLCDTMTLGLGDSCADAIRARGNE